MLHFKVPTVQMYSFARSVRIIVILSYSFTHGQKPKVTPIQPYIYMFIICMLYAKTMYYLIWAQCHNKRCFNSSNKSLQSKRTQPWHPEMQCYPFSSDQWTRKIKIFFMKSDDRVAKGTQKDYLVTSGYWYKSHPLDLLEYL